jgi:hypothetical protein
VVIPITDLLGPKGYRHCTGWRLEPNTMELGDFSLVWPCDLAFYASLEVKGDSR